MSGLTSAGIEPVEIDCPHGYTQRKALAALPLAGRFTTAGELRQAFCVEDVASSAFEPEDVLSTRTRIDFEESDVVSFAFDARTGTTPLLLQRGNELWLRVSTRACSGAAPDIASVTFIVPKASTITEQTCALSCR